MATGILENQDQETGEVTGTPDQDYNLVWFLQQCLSNTLRLEIYARDAERTGDSELAEFFRRAQGESKKGAEQSKRLLRDRLAKSA
jgi:rubrerythrin